MLDKAYDEVLKLPRAVKGAIYDFQHKFRENPNSPGLQFKQLQGTTLFSARVNLDYRALLLHDEVGPPPLSGRHRSAAPNGLDAVGLSHTRSIRRSERSRRWCFPR